MVAALILAALAAATPTPSPTPTATPTATPHPIATLLDASAPNATPTAGAPAPGLGARVKLKATRITDRPGDEAEPGSRLLVVPKRATQPGEAGPAGDSLDEVATKAACAKRWPLDLGEQVRCLEASHSLAARQAGEVPTTDFERIRSHCRSQWTDNPIMQDYCERNELEAWHRLHATP